MDGMSMGTTNAMLKNAFKRMSVRSIAQAMASARTTEIAAATRAVVSEFTTAVLN